MLPAKSASVSPKGMIFLYDSNPAFREGLYRHGLLDDTCGLRFHNTSFDQRPFQEKWGDHAGLREAQKLNRPYYLDRITGGMPYQSLDGIRPIARKLRDDPNFLGFQVHEWGNSPIHDHRRINEFLIDKGLPFDREHFAPYVGRLVYPFFSSGDFDTYQDLFRPLNTIEDTARYLKGFFQHRVDLTSGQVMAVNGYVQLYHTALKLGAKNVMAEIGNQVPLSAVQIACVRGAARQYGKPFGVYYEPWGGKPFGCPCALGWSPWFARKENPDGKVMGHRIRPELGSSRSLQRRLLFFSWLSGATYYAEEWGTENYFKNWDDYPLTDYGRVAKSFVEVSRGYTRPVPVVPAALVMPPDALAIDVQYLCREKEVLYRVVPPDPFHVRLRAFATDILAARPRRGGADDYNLTPSPWIGCFDVLSAEAPETLLRQYGLLIYFDKQQARQATVPAERIQVYMGESEDAGRCISSLRKLLSFQVQGEVGCAHARTDDRYLLGIFNNLGVTKTDKGETQDPAATRTALVRGPVTGMIALVGEQYITRSTEDVIEARIPAGDLVLLSFPDPARTP